MTQADRRRQVLLAWAHQQRERGEQVPDNAQLAEIAVVRGIPPVMRTPLMDRWVDVINNLLWLSDQGHPDPVAEGMKMAPRQVPGYAAAAVPASVPGGQVNPQVAQQMAAWQQQAAQADQFARQAMAYGHQADARNWLIRKQHAERELANLQRFAAAQSAASAASQASAASYGSATSYGSAASYGSATSQQSAASHPSATEAVSGVPAPPSAGPTPDWQPAAEAEIVEAEVVEPETGAAGTDAVVAEAVEVEVVEPEPEPEPPAPEPAPAPEPEIDPLQKLMVWRDQSGNDDLKDRHLRQIVNSGASNESEVAVGLPASLKYLAPAIAAELGISGPGEPAPGPVAQPHPAPPGAAPEPAAPQGHPELLNPAAISWQQPMELAQALSGFVSMDFSGRGGEPVRLKASALPDQTINLRWPEYEAPEGTYVIYRVVADDEFVPYSPDMSEVIAVTKQTHLVDNRPFYSAVRHYQVWVNVGRDDRDAQLNQPVLHAKAPVVAKPDDVDIREDEGRVIGQWRVFPEVTKVQIFRVPAERANSGAANPSYRILEADANLGGFVDDGAEAGRRYIYQLLVQAEVEGTPQLSLPTIVPLTTSAVLHGVPDLRCQLNDDQAHPQFDLIWSPPPAGRVLIYRTELPPVAGADAETVPEDALAQMNLRAADRLAHPIERHGQDQGAFEMMRNVPWPRDWSRLYFTPVTLLDGKAKVGATTSQVRTGRVEDAVVVERVAQQVLTMDWPVGAANIKVYEGARGLLPEEAIPGAEPVAEISEETYRRLGGLYFPRQLDRNGCDLHLVPVSFAGGRSVEGRPTTVPYRGLLRLDYEVQVQRTPGQSVLYVSMRADRFMNSSPPFVLVHHPTRLPLDVRDGEALPMWLNNGQPQQPNTRFQPQSLNTSLAAPGWITDVTNRTGWVRLFVDWLPSPDRGTVALIDPSVNQLYLGDPQ